MNISEQIKALLVKLAEKTAEKNAFVVSKGVDATPEDVEKAKAFIAEIKAIEDRLEVLKDAEKSLIEQAKAVPATDTGVAVKDAAGITVKSNKQKGATMARFALTMMAAKGNLALAEGIATKHYKDDAETLNIVKAAVAAASTSVPAWAGNLIYPETYAADFIELLYPQTVLGRLSMKKVPFNVRIVGQNGGTQVGWVGEAKNVPVTSAAFYDVKLGWNKVYAIAAFDQEIIKFSNPAVESLVLADLVKATAQGLDTTFLGSQARTDHSPAGVMAGVTPVASGSTITPGSPTYTALDLIEDLQTAIAPFILANYDVSGIKFLMSPARALHIGSMRNSLGAKWFPDLGINGGTLEGFEVITSNNIAGTVIDIVFPNEIYMSEDAGPELDYSREASLIMSSTPDTDAATVQPVSMFQTNQVAVKIGQFIDWQPRRALVAAQISGADKYK